MHSVSLGNWNKFLCPKNTYTVSCRGLKVLQYLTYNFDDSIGLNADSELSSMYNLAFTCRIYNTRPCQCFSHYEHHERSHRTWDDVLELQHKQASVNGPELSFLMCEILHAQNTLLLCCIHIHRIQKCSGLNTQTLA